MILRGVPENSAELTFADYYLVSDRTLLDGEKLTEELKAAFEREETVLCRVYWKNLWGNLDTMDKREREELAARSIGLSGMAELEASDDLELHQRFLEALRNLNSHSAELEELAGRLFRDGELQEIREYSGCFLVTLNRDRASQVADAPEVGFLHVGVSEAAAPVVAE